jgi:hypothetical protein
VRGAPTLLLLVGALGCDRSIAQPDGCGGATSADCTTAPPYHNGFLISQITFPDSPSSFARDIDGDGVPENEFFAVVAQFRALGLAISGSPHLLLEVESNDPAFRDDTAGYLRFYWGNLGSNANYVIDGNIAPTALPASAAGGMWSSPDPLSSRHPELLSLPLTLGAGAPIALPVGGIVASFDFSSGNPTGSLTGFVLWSDAQQLLLPPLAAHGPIDPSIHPDVQVPGGTMKDALSFGIGFATLPADWVEN